MKTARIRKLSGFTLIELMVVIAILAVVGSIAFVTIYGKVSAGNDQKCKENLAQLATLGQKYGEDRAHSTLLPTSGMDDDPDTENVIETHGWWIALAQLEESSAVVPTKPKEKIKLPGYFHCPNDARAEVAEGKMFPADYKTVSYVSWTDASEDPENPNSCIRTSAKQHLDSLPWLTDGNPVKSQSVHDLEGFTKMVMPATERHKGTIMVLYASGLVKAVEADADMKPEEVFAAIAPDMARAEANAPAGKKGKKGKKDAKDKKKAKK
ncbi:MAG: type II secretion system protein [Akkermansia sp.]|nr:type II secretion system protein [Akkermansia sp.]